MRSYRRKSVEVDSLVEEAGAIRPETLQEYLTLFKKVADIAVEGYTTVTVTIKGRPEELEDLANELQIWTPAGGWSSDALRLFEALRGE